MRSPVILLGPRRVRLGEDVLAEPEGCGLEALEEMLAARPRAAVVTSEGEGGFYRASLCLERGVGRVVLGRGALPPAWETELAARAKLFGAELFVHDDAHGYTRVKPGPRASVGVPFADAPPLDAATLGLAPSPFSREQIASAPPLPRAEVIPGLPQHMEEIAFQGGDKPVLYLVVPAPELEAVRARHAGASVVIAGEAPASLGVEGATGRRVYGREGGAHAHVFVSQNPSLAARAAALWEGGSSKNAGAIGELLGYPACCASAFVALAERGNNAALVYVTDGRTRALGASYHSLLDAAVRRIVPFTPCTFGCARALRLAERVLVGLAPNIAEALVRDLSRPVLYFDEARAVVFEGAQKTAEGLAFNVAFFLEPAAPLAPDVEMEARRLFGWLFARGGELFITNDKLVVKTNAETRTIERVSPKLGTLLPFGLT